MLSEIDIESRLSDVFTRLSIRCLELELPGYAENFCNLLVALRSGIWQQLDQDAKGHWLDKVAELLHPKALGDSLPDFREPVYIEAVELIDALRRSVRQAR